MTDPITAAEARGAIDRNWVVLSGDDQYLHTLPDTTDPDLLMVLADGESAHTRTACDRTDRCWIPGTLDRMEATRCPACCDAVGLPHGVGSPKNDRACRTLLGLDPPSTTPPTPEYGDCRGCGHRYHLTRSGLVSRHSKPDTTRTTCSGSGKTPILPVPPARVPGATIVHLPDPEVTL